MKKQADAQIADYTYPVMNLGEHLQEMKNILSNFITQDTVNRIWHKDHTVWKPKPTEISNRLGWLDVIDKMSDQIIFLQSFADEIKQAAFHHVVLLGMGGSSLGPEVLRKTFGSAPGYPELTVLDSTVPAWVEEVVKSIIVRHTLFLVSSKSGTTTETLSQYKYFRDLVEKEVGTDQAGLNFVAITDEGTPLAQLAKEKAFRRTFLNPSDIGGRYSVLSYFGLVPAALAGIDLKRLLETAEQMQESCAPCVNIYENPAIWLGALIGTCALHGRDKLTLIVSPSVSKFGLWLEQLLAESTGKEGKGIIPIIDEPLVYPEFYGRDRIFVYLRMEGDQNNEIDRFVELLEMNGQPVVQLRMKDQYDLGAQFFRWELATAVAGIVLGINPFDQPDVQSTKDATRQLLERVKSKRLFSRVDYCREVGNWLLPAMRGNYLGLMVYMKQTPQLEQALNDLRRAIIERYKIATTVGYGPRFLHSTGQLHKGGPNSGLFIQILSQRRKDLKIPGEPYTFGILTQAEAQGDYQALQDNGRKVTRIPLCSGTKAAVERLAKLLV